jgi:1-aminocyclopropane-1-carboxylate deaminase/D-cysteine desulfhydrase-like pyridoxal-dependent ACC family enzyme
MLSLVNELPENLVILSPKKKYHFAKLYPNFLEIYHKLLKVGIEFDLLYAPGMWEALLDQTDEEVLYIHSGGVTGNKTMLSRYLDKNHILT